MIVNHTQRKQKREIRPLKQMQVIQMEKSFNALELHYFKETDGKIIWVTPEAEKVTLRLELDTGEEILEKAAPAFPGRICNLTHMKAQLILEDDAKVEAELQQSEDRGVISKVDWCDWATPIVPEVKKTGAIRICGDFMVTVNPVLHADQYPLRRTSEDINGS
ncbi:hypothetical protein N1851_034657 [Merluccius polli]|uniref:Uncharacterized protein n=1 Tax=Merluccius polli TaxID=89951 RepID=A0AA47LZC4_MERPO|nr:hypothetical protein N1851_034657 [Merluccius polli]